MSARLGLWLVGALALSNAGCIFLLIPEEERSTPPSVWTGSAPNQPPSVVSISVADWPPIGPEGTVVISASDDRSLSGVEMIFAQTSTRALSGSYETFNVDGTALGEGFGDFLVRVTDSNGGWAERTVTDLLVYLTPPTIQSFGTTVPASGPAAHVDLWVADAWVLGGVTLGFRGATLSHEFPPGYPSTLGVDWDGSLVTFDTSELPQGYGTAEITATDAAGNSSIATFALHVDGTPPVAAITSPAPGAVVSGHFDVAIEAGDEYQGPVWVDVSVGGASVASAAGSGTLTLDAADFAAGQTVIRAVATDEAGNHSAAVEVPIEIAHDG